MTVKIQCPLCGQGEVTTFKGEMVERLDVERVVTETLHSLGCTLHVEDGIVYVLTPSKELWDFTIPTRKEY